MYIFAILINHETRNVISVKISCGGCGLSISYGNDEQFTNRTVIVVFTAVKCE